MAARDMVWRLNAAKRGPIVASLAVGVGHSPVRFIGFRSYRTDALEFGDLLLSSGMPLAVCIRNDENAITEVIGANGCRRNAIPLRIIPARGQVSEYDVHPSR